MHLLILISNYCYFVKKKKKKKKVKGGEGGYHPRLLGSILSTICNCNSKEKAKGKRVNPLVITHQLELKEKKRNKKTQRNKRNKRRRRKSKAKQIDLKMFKLNFMDSLPTKTSNDTSWETNIERLKGIAERSSYPQPTAHK